MDSSCIDSRLPVHILYAQKHGRSVDGSDSMLKCRAAAIRLKTNYSWGIYVATVTLGLYSHLLFSLVALGHGIYLVVTEKQSQ